MIRRKKAKKAVFWKFCRNECLQNQELMLTASIRIVLLKVLFKTQKLAEFFCSNFKLDRIRVQWYVFLRNANSIKLEILKIFKPKLTKLVSNLKLKLEKLIWLDIDMCSNSKLSSSMKLDLMKCELVEHHFWILPTREWNICTTLLPTPNWGHRWIL